MGESTIGRRGVSPVVGIVAMVAVAVVLSAVAGGMLLALSEDPEPSPDVTFSIEAGGAPGQYQITHEGGDRVEGGALKLQGAADPDALDGTALSAGERGTIYAVEETVQAVWVGDDGTSYVVWEFDLQDDTDASRNAAPGVDDGTTVPDPDRGCPWVEEESDGGTEKVDVDDEVVNCDVVTDDQIETQVGGVIVGDSEAREVDGDEARFYGDVTAEKVVNVQDGVVTGAVTSENQEVKLFNVTVAGPVTAADKVEVHDGSTVDGDVESDGDVSVDDATVSGDVYVDDADTDFTCTDATVDGQPCDDYEPRDPDA